MSPKTDNSSPKIKLDLRRRLLALLSEPARVFETHCGAGTMTPAYQGADRWLGGDVSKKYPQVVQVDCRRLLRALDLNDFNFFDVDAYGNPFECVWLVSQRRTARTPLVFALTCGAFAGVHKVSITLGAAGFSRQMLDVIRAPDPASLFAGVWKDSHALLFFRACFLVWFPSFDLNSLEIIPGYKPGRKEDLTCWYIGALLRPKATQEGKATE